MRHPAPTPTLTPRHASQVALLRAASRDKFDTTLSGLRVSPDVGKQMGDAVQVLFRALIHILFCVGFFNMGDLIRRSAQPTGYLALGGNRVCFMRGSH